MPDCVCPQCNEETIRFHHLFDSRNRPDRVWPDPAADSHLQRKLPRQRLRHRRDHQRLFLDAIHLRARLGPAFRPDRAAAGAAGQHLLRVSFLCHFRHRLRPVQCHRGAGRDVCLALVRGHLRGEHHRGPGLYRRHHPARKSLRQNGIDRHGLRPRLCLRPGLRRGQQQILWRDRARLDRRPPLRAEFYLGLLWLGESWKPAEHAVTPAAPHRAMAAHPARPAPQSAHRHLFSGHLLLHLF